MGGQRGVPDRTSQPVDPGGVGGLREVLGFTQVRAFVRSGSEATRSAVSKGEVRRGNLLPSSVRADDGGFINRPFLPSNFASIFGKPFFRHFIDFEWIVAPFWLHFGIIFHTCCMPFSNIDFRLNFYGLFMILSVPGTTFYI